MTRFGWRARCFCVGALVLAAAPGGGCPRQADKEVPMGSPAGVQPGSVEAAVAEYLAREKSWKPEQYRIEHKGTDENGNTVVWAIFLEDERKPVPGGGQSVELTVDRSNQVIKEMRWQ